MKTLHLTLKKKWFDMIESGDKPEEYREPTDFILPRLLELHRPFIQDRFCIKYDKIIRAYWYCVGFKGARDKALAFLLTEGARWRDYDSVTFQNGYKKDAPRITLQFKGCEYREGNQKWGAEPGLKYFVIKLGERL